MNQFLTEDGSRTESAAYYRNCALRTQQRAALIRSPQRCSTLQAAVLIVDFHLLTQVNDPPMS